ncbi:MAG: [citrate (pro-3S)-lyase] ligase [Opitutaceae bacterium]|nr:[citrate (pro-3S)-lyase] ligase [Opitutaceae bacterium]
MGLHYGTITSLNCASDIQEAREFVRKSGLDFEEGFDDLVGAYDNGKLVAVGARAGNVLKMIAVEPSYQGGALLGDIVSALIERGSVAGFDSLFVYTKPEYSTSFEALNFSLLASQERVALLEYGKGLERWFSSKRSLRKPGKNGGIVVNCNPFTWGHRYLIEAAARQVDNLYVFVVREDRSIFPFDIRYQLVREGVSDLANVILLDTGSYAVSSATFPTYFLKKNDPAAQIQMELDVTLFAAKLAPYFGITARFVGTEPYCAMTGSYNDAMKRILPVYGIDLIEIERKQVDGSAISASRVRKLLADDDFATLGKLVPPATLSFLRTGSAGSIFDKLKHSTERN